jgi:hypothetical protein
MGLHTLNRRFTSGAPSAGSEVDLVVESAGNLIPIEVKLSATPRPAMAAGIRIFQEDLGQQAISPRAMVQVTTRSGPPPEIPPVEQGGMGTTSSRSASESP